MQRLDGQLVLSPTDLTHHQECAHLTRLDLGVAAGEWAGPGRRGVRRSCSSSSTAASTTRSGTWRRWWPREVGRRDRGGFRCRRTPSRRGADGRGDAPRRRRRLPGHLLRRRLGRAGRLPAQGATGTSLFGDWLVRDRRHQARPQAQGRRAAADGHLRRAADGAPGGRAAADPRRHRRRRLAPVAAGRRRRVRPPRAGAAGDVRGRAAGHRPLADRLLRAVPLGGEVQHRPASGRRPRPGRLHARRPPRRAARRRHHDAGRAGRRRPPEELAGLGHRRPTPAPDCSSRRPSS